MERSRNLRFLLELGRGGMGVVYLAVAEGPAGFQKLKVIKRLRSDLASEPKAVEMFLEEARLAARLHHPNIVQTNEVGFDGKHYFLELEYLEGQSFDALVRNAQREGKDVPLPIACWILSHVLAALHYAHELKSSDGAPLAIVHRDVSPHNVMITYDGEVKLLDFGIAKAADSSSETQTGVVKGKVTYMAPEQAKRAPVDRRADLFAVGVMLWQALTNKRLWGEANDFEVWSKLHGDAPIPSPRESAEDAPDALVRICERALSRDPNERPATAAAMRAELEAWLATQPAVGARDVAALLEDVFAEQRKIVRAEIDLQLRGGPTGLSAVDVPVLGDRRAEAEAITRSGTGAGTSTISSSATVRKREVRGLRAIAFGAIGVALLASGAAVLGTRARRASPANDAAPAAPRLCESNKACTADARKPSICRPTKGCVALEADGCTLLAEPGDLENDRSVLLGAMLPLTGPKGPIGTSAMRAIDLARRDFAQIAHGVPAPDGSTRPVAVLVCDDANGGAAATHLANAVGVPGVTGFGTSQEVIDLAEATFVPARVLTVSAMNISDLITAVPHPPGAPRLVFRTMQSSHQVTTPLVHIVPELLEPRIRGGGYAGPIRVAFVRPKTTALATFTDALFRELRFNGHSVAENGPLFREVSIPAAEDQAPAASFEPAVDALLDMRPHVVIYIGQEDLVKRLFAPVEARWPRGEPRPYYLSTGSSGGNVGELYPFLGKDAALRRRFLGVSVASTVANAKFTMRLNETFGTSVPASLSPAAPYDALYVMVYAAFAANTETLDGLALARGVRRLVPPGPKIEVGPSSILEGLQTLRRGENIDLDGAYSSLDFDLETGETSADYVVECIGVDAQSRAAGVVESGARFDARAKHLVGELACP